MQTVSVFVDCPLVSCSIRFPVRALVQTEVERTYEVEFGERRPNVFARAKIRLDRGSLAEHFYRIHPYEDVTERLREIEESRHV